VKHLWPQLKLRDVSDPRWTLARAGKLAVLSLLDGPETVAQLRLTPSDALLLAQQLISLAQDEGAEGERHG
jgi:hypothetical protein